MRSREKPGEQTGIFSGAARFVFLAFVAVLFIPAQMLCSTCATCHPKEAKGFAQTAMARSLASVSSQPEATFEDALARTTFTIRNNANGVVQSFERDGISQTVDVQYAIGSGTHAFGYLAQIEIGRASCRERV